MSNGRVTTFYSYKGGVGRTFLLANVAWLLARWGRRVLCLDWDLEAPGLYRYLAPESPPRQGVLDLVLELGDDRPTPDWRRLCHEVSGPWQPKGLLHMIDAGRRDDDFIRRVQGLHWDQLSEQGLEAALERIRAEWVQSYDHVLVDSRTGITDAGGICAAQLPDLLVLAFTATHQSLEGAVQVANMAQEARRSMPIDRAGFSVLPIPCRIHTAEEEELEKEWSAHFENLTSRLFEPWKDRGVAAREYISHLRLREQARWSFGEQLPVRTEALDDPNRISYAFANVAALVDQRLEESGALIRARHEYLAKVVGQAGLQAPEAQQTSEYDVFISYPRAENTAAESLATALRAKSLRVFLDLDMPLGANWSEALYRARERSRTFLVLLPDYGLGEGQTEELVHIARRMTERGVTVVPIFLTPNAIASAPASLADLFGLVLPEDGPWERVAARIAGRVQRQTAARASPTRGVVAVFPAGREVTHLVISPRGDQCVAALSDGSLASWKLPEGTFGRSLEGHAFREIRSLAISGDGMTCATVADDELKTWNLHDGSMRRTQRPSFAHVTSLALAYDGAWAMQVGKGLAGNKAGDVALWQELSTQSRALGRHDASIAAVVVDEHAVHGVSGGYDNSIKVWELATRRALLSHDSHPMPVSALAIALKGRSWVSCTGHTLILWDLNSAKPLREFVAHAEEILAIAISEDGKVCASTSVDKTLKIWNAATGVLLHSVAGDASFTKVAVSQDGRVVVAANQSDEVHVVSGG